MGEEGAVITGGVGRVVAGVLDDLCADGVFATGGQVWVSHRGRVVVDAAAGDCSGRAVTPSSLHSVFCATKPLLGIAVGHLIDAGAISLDDPVDRYVDVAVGRGVRVAELLDHRAGLRHPSGAAWRMTRRSDRVGLLADGVMAAPRAAYSEIAAWQLLGELVTAVTGIPADAFVERDVIDPLGLGADLIVGGHRAAEALASGRVRTAVGGLPHDRVPLLSELLPDQIAETSAAFGGLASMRGLGGIYAAVNRALRGDTVPGMPRPATLAELVTPRHPPEIDPVLGRSCRFAGGFMVGLVDHRVSATASSAAVGHSAGITCCAGLADPIHDLAVGVYLNGAVLDADDMATTRLGLIDAVYTAVDAVVETSR